jgi:hypothetical protein
MKRTQLYLHDDIWKVLHIRARQQHTSVSDLVREAVREKYGNSTASRAQAMRGLIGLWKNREDLPDTNAYIRKLRKGKGRRRRMR